METTLIRQTRVPDRAIMAREAARLMNEPAFLRSPVMSRLLDYLVRMTLEGQGDRIKSYTIAVDALGRSGESIEEIDAYARVAVGRLRKMLDAAYAGRVDGERLSIETGSYKVKLERGDAEEPPALPIGQTEHQPSPVPQPTAGQLHLPMRLARKRQVVLLLALMAILAGLVWFTQHSAEQRRKWTKSNLPTLGVSADCSADRALGCETMVQSLWASLRQYQGYRFLEDPRKPADFVVELNGRADAGMTISVVESATGRLVWWSRLREVGNNAGERTAQLATFRIASPGGAIYALLRRRDLPTDTPLGCWVRFTEGVELLNTVGDAVLADCAADWYAASPNHPVAAFLHAWTLTDSATTSLNSKSRQRKLDQALSVLHRAMALNPEVASLKVGAMRTYSISGNRSKVQETARRALVQGEGNLTVAAMAGFGLALWNDSEGERVLRRMALEDPHPLPLVHVGLFAAAMMRDDPLEAGTEVEHFEPYQNGHPFLTLLKAAQQARSGRVKEAELAVAELKQQPRIRLIGLTGLIDRAPCAPEAKKRLRQWLAPLLQSNGS